jgi:hypothetical protein
LLIWGSGEDMESGVAERVGTGVEVHSFDFGEDNQFLFGVLTGAFAERPEVGVEGADPFHAAEISSKATETRNEADYQNMMRIKQHNDSISFIKKGALYYDRQKSRNIRRDTDSTGELTDKPAKDTLDNLP